MAFFPKHDNVFRNIVVGYLIMTRLVFLVSNIFGDKKVDHTSETRKWLKGNKINANTPFWLP